MERRRPGASVSWTQCPKGQASAALTSPQPQRDGPRSPEGMDTQTHVHTPHTQIHRHMHTHHTRREIYTDTQTHTSHRHTDTRTHTTYAEMHIDTCTHTTHAERYTQTHVHTHHTHKHRYTQTDVHITYTHRYTQTHTDTRRHTHTHRVLPLVSCWRLAFLFRGWKSIISRKTFPTPRLL